MSKYSLEFKHSVVLAYDEGDGGAEMVASRFGVDHSTVRKWVSAFAAHGLKGLEKKYSRYDATFKLSVLQRMWDDGLSYRQTAAIFDIRNKSRIVDWARRYESGGLEALIPRRKGRLKAMSRPPATTDEPQAASLSDATKSREELLSELAYLRMENDYLKKLEALTQEQALTEKRKPFRR
jgi:transposase